MNFRISLSQALSGGNFVALPLALAGGVLAGLNPCCLALYPAATGACCSLEEPQTIRRSFGNAIAFVLGLALAIAALGAMAAYIGRVVDVGAPMRYAIAVIPILMGLYRLRWVRFTTSTPKPLRAGFGGAFGTGLLLSLIIGPCGTPVLASILSYAAYKQSFIYGGLLLFIYGLGSSLPLVLLGTAAGGFLKRLDCSRFGRVIDPLLGGSLVLLGLYLVSRI